MKLSTYTADAACRFILCNGVWKVWQGENARRPVWKADWPW